MARARSISKVLICSAAATLSFGCASSESGDDDSAAGEGSVQTGSTSTVTGSTMGSASSTDTGSTGTGTGSTGTGSTGTGSTGTTGTGGASTGTSTSPGTTGTGGSGTGGSGTGGSGAGGSGGAGGGSGTAMNGAGGSGGAPSDSAGGAGGEPGAGGSGGDPGTSDDDMGSDDMGSDDMGADDMGADDMGTDDMGTDDMGADDMGADDDADPGSDSGMSAGCGTEPTIPSNMYNNGERISITAAGMERRYILRVPDDYDNTKPYKLIIAWHQLDGNDVQMYANDYYHLFPLSGGNAIFAAPNGQKNGGGCTTTGNGDGGCGWPNPNNSDLALGDAVVDEIKANFCIDNNRIFATGWSYGGSMSYKHACERGLGGTKDGVEGYLRGIAVYSGAQLSGQCTPSTPVAYYGSHGLSDNVLNYNGGVGLAQNFAGANGCNWMTPPQASGNHVCTDISGCSDGYPVQFCSFTGGHTPDPSDGGGGSWQYQLVWDFFDQF